MYCTTNLRAKPAKKSAAHCTKCTKLHPVQIRVIAVFTKIVCSIFTLIVRLL